MKNYAHCQLFLGNDRPLAALGGLAVRQERIMKEYSPSDGMASARDVCPSVVSTLLRSPTVVVLKLQMTLFMQDQDSCPVTRKLWYFIVFN